MNASIRIGVVGAGAIAQVAHLPALAKLKGTELVSLCDADGPKAHQLADRFGIPNVFTDIEDLLAGPALDGVIIMTPNHLHEPHVPAQLRVAPEERVEGEEPLRDPLRVVEPLDAEDELAVAVALVELRFDRRGRRVTVPVSRVAYVEVGAPASERRVGFGAP